MRLFRRPASWSLPPAALALAVLGCGAAGRGTTLATAPPACPAHPPPLDPRAEGVIRPPSTGDARRPAPDAPVIACPCGEPSCQFAGLVRAMRPAVRPVEVSQVQPGVQIFLDATAEATCPTTLGEAASPAALPAVGSLFVALPEGVAQPIREGERVCGFVRAFAGGADAGREGLVTTSAGTPLVAFAGEHPRAPSPLPGWAFEFTALSWNQPRPEGYEWFAYAMTVTHGGGQAIVADNQSRPMTLKAADGLFAVGGHGYVTEGALPPSMQWAGERGYAFWLVRTHDI